MGVASDTTAAGDLAFSIAPPRLWNDFNQNLLNATI